MKAAGFFQMIAFVVSMIPTMAFVPSKPASTSTLLRMSELTPKQFQDLARDEFTKKEKKKKDNDIFESVAQSFKNFNVDTESLFDNEMLGKRGELYVAAQLALLLCIFWGGVPLVGDLINVILGPGFFVAGVAVIYFAVADLGEMLTLFPVPRETGGVVDRGMYSKVRHPMYSGMLAVTAGFSVLTGSVDRLLLTAALGYTLNLMANKEEMELTEKFKEEYEYYKESVPDKFFPFAAISNINMLEKEEENNNRPNNDNDMALPPPSNKN